MHSLRFTNEEALQVALTSGLVPAEVQTLPVRFARFGDGSIVVRPPAELKSADRDRLRRAGVVTSPPAQEWQPASCWAEVLPTERIPDHEPDLRDVLFLVPEDGAALGLAAEMLRLGCDRQVYCFAGEGEDVRYAAVRAQDAPYYTAIRAIDRYKGIRAFVPVTASRNATVWIEMGWSHPLAANVQAPEGRLLLLSPTAWSTVADGPWRDIYTLVDIALPASDDSHTPIEPPRRLTVPLRLARAARAEAPALWVIREDAVDKVDALVNQVPNDLLARLLFAVSEDVVVLRARLGRQGPPALEIDGDGFAPLMQIPNLFKPHDRMVEPPLRRDKIRELLAPEPDEIAWLAPTEDGFRVERISERAFEPLTEWVDYLVHRSVDSLEPWVRAAAFQFEAFESIGVEWAEAPAQAEAAPRRSRREREAEPKKQERRATVQVPKQQKKRTQKPAIQLPDLQAVQWEPTEVEKELAELEQQFLALEAAADAPERQELWQQMATLNARLERGRDAGLCWTRSMWELDEDEAPGGLARWAGGELGLLGETDPDDATETLLALPTPTRDQTRAMASLVALCADQEVGAIAGDLHRVAVWLDQHDDNLDVRSLWLARLALAQLVGGDALALTRTRDRILARLHQGLSGERDVPTFLRFLGRGAGGDATAVGALVAQLDALRDRYDRTERRRSVIEAKPEWTRAYVNFVFAVGYARLGKSDRARQLRAQAAGALDRTDPVHRVLTDAWSARVDQALEGLPPEAPLPAEVAGAFNELDLFMRYKVDRLRQASRVLESQERLDPVTAFQLQHADPRGPEFTEMRGMTDPDALSAAVDRILQTATARSTTPDERARLFDGVMDFYPLLPASRAVPNLEFVVRNLSGIPRARRATLLQEAMVLAGYFGRGDMARELVSNLKALIGTLESDEAATVVGQVGGALRSLRRVGLREEGRDLLNTMASAVQGDDTAALVARLNTCGGLAFLGHLDAARPTFEAANRVLDKQLPMPERLQITRAAAEALSLTPQEFAIAGLGRLVQQLPLITDSFNTNSHFCLSVIQFMDAIVIGYASEDLALGELGRRWLDDDEYLVRRRIHRDLGAHT